MKLLCKSLGVLQHIAIILSVSFLAFIVLDWYNPMMAFTTNPVSAKLLIAFCMITILSSVGNLLLERHISEALTQQRGTGANK
jgi:ABC-type transport system involved in cytochrome bd biosynthesis fused ATPase/permease subunit